MGEVRGGKVEVGLFLEARALCGLLLVITVTAIERIQASQPRSPSSSLTEASQLFCSRLVTFSSLCLNGRTFPVYGMLARSEYLTCHPWAEQAKALQDMRSAVPALKGGHQTTCQHESDEPCLGIGINIEKDIEV